jgi:hypothetical protein
MVEQGGHSGEIVSIDISSVAVEQMQALHAKLPQLKYSVGDARCVLGCGVCWGVWGTLGVINWPAALLAAPVVC